MFRRSLLAFILIFSSTVSVFAEEIEPIIEGYSLAPYFQNNAITTITLDYLLDFFVDNHIFDHVLVSPSDIKSHLSSWYFDGYDSFVFYFLQNSNNNYRQLLCFASKSSNIPTGFWYIPTILFNITDEVLGSSVGPFSTSSGRYMMFLSASKSGGNVYSALSSDFLSINGSHSLPSPPVRLAAITQVHRFRIEPLNPPTPPEPPDPPVNPPLPGGDQHIDIYVDNQYIDRVDEMNINSMDTQSVNNIENQINETVNNQTNYISDTLTTYITNEYNDYLKNEYYDFITEEYHQFITEEYITNEYHDFITEEYHEFVTEEHHKFETNNNFFFPDDFDGEGFFPVQEALLTAILVSLNSFANDSAYSSIAIRKAISDASKDIVSSVNDVELAVNDVQISVENVETTIFSQFTILFDSLNYWFDGFGYLFLIVIFVISIFFVFYLLINSWRFIYISYRHLIG